MSWRHRHFWRSGQLWCWREKVLCLHLTTTSPNWLNILYCCNKNANKQKQRSCLPNNLPSLTDCHPNLWLQDYDFLVSDPYFLHRAPEFGVIHLLNVQFSLFLCLGSYICWMLQFSYQFASPNSICELVFEGLPLSNSYRFDRFQNQKIRFTAHIVVCTWETLEGCLTRFNKIDQMNIK